MEKQDKLNFVEGALQRNKEQLETFRGELSSMTMEDYLRGKAWKALELEVTVEWLFRAKESIEAGDNFSDFKDRFEEKYMEEKALLQVVSESTYLFGVMTAKLEAMARFKMMYMSWIKALLNS